MAVPIRYKNVSSVDKDVIKYTTMVEIEDYEEFFKYIIGAQYRTADVTDEAENNAGGDACIHRFQIKMFAAGSGAEILQQHYRSLNDVSVDARTILILPDGRTITLVENKVKQVQAMEWQPQSKIYKYKLVDAMKTTNVKSLKFKHEFLIKNVAIEHNYTDILQTEVINDFEKSLYDQLFADVTIKSIDDIEHSAHKVVLASRSGVMKAHFDHNTTECSTNIIQFPFESEVLQEILMFMYTGKSQNLDIIPEKILPAANYYQLTTLKNLCEKALSKKLKFDNAIDTLQLAELYSAEKLAQSTLNFIGDGEMSLIIKTESWKNLTDVQLIKKIIEHVSNINIHKITYDNNISI